MSDAAVQPVREKVNCPLSGPASEALGSLAVTVTAGRSSSAIVTVALLGEPME